jgi:hypothetical protein
MKSISEFINEAINGRSGTRAKIDAKTLNDLNTLVIKEYDDNIKNAGKKALQKSYEAAERIMKAIDIKKLRIAFKCDDDNHDDWIADRLSDHLIVGKPFLPDDPSFYY